MYNLVMPTKIDRELMRVGNTYEDVVGSTFGVYGYFLDNGDCIYIGIDSNIHLNTRHMHHMSPSKRTEQAINSYVQSNAMKGLTYNVLHVCRDKVEMENLETMMILFYKSLGQCRFNKVVALNEDMTKQLLVGIAEIGRN